MVKGAKTEAARPDFLADAGAAAQGRGEPSARVAAVTSPAPAKKKERSESEARRLHSMPARIWADEYREVRARLAGLDERERPSVSALFRALVTLSLADKKLWARAVERAQGEQVNKGGRPPIHKP